MRGPAAPRARTGEENATMTYDCPVCQRSFAEPGFCPFDGKQLVDRSAADKPTVLDDPDTRPDLRTQPGVGDSTNKLHALSAHEGHADAIASMRKRVSEYDRLVGETLDGRYYV